VSNVECIGAISLTLALLVCPALEAEAAGSTRPPAFVPCELYAGESQLVDSTCKVTNLTGGQIRIEEVGGKGHIMRVKPEGYYDRLFWNGEPPEGEPKTLLGVSQWLHTCWRSLPQTEVPFTLCLIPSRPAK